MNTSERTQAIKAHLDVQRRAADERFEAFRKASFAALAGDIGSALQLKVSDATESVPAVLHGVPPSAVRPFARG